MNKAKCTCSIVTASSIELLNCFKVTYCFATMRQPGLGRAIITTILTYNL